MAFGILSKKSNDIILSLVEYSDNFLRMGVNLIHVLFLQQKQKVTTLPQYCSKPFDVIFRFFCAQGFINLRKQHTGNKHAAFKGDITTRPAAP